MKQRTLTALAIVFALALPARVAHGEEGNADMPTPLVVTEVALLSAGAIALTPGVISLVRRERASTWWHVLGWITGLLNTGVGLYAAIALLPDDGDHPWGIVGVGQAVLGVATIVTYVLDDKTWANVANAVGATIVVNEGLGAGVASPEPMKALG